jgi:hypothetical protein
MVAPASSTPPKKPTTPPAPPKPATPPAKPEAKPAAPSPKDNAAQKTQQAEAARSRAGAAQQKATQDQHAADTARQANQQAQADKTKAAGNLQTAKSHLDSLNNAVDQRGPRTGQLDQLKKAQTAYDGAKTKSDAANAAADKAQKAQTQTEETARNSRRAALDTANKAIRAEKAANDANREAGQPEPYKQANQVKDVYDGGSLNAKDQEQLFGAKSVVTPAEAGKADAARVSDAAKQGPAQGAAELNRQLQQNGNQDYRSSLVDNSQGALGQIKDGLKDPNTSAQDASHAVQSLAGAADAAGDKGRTQIASAVGDASKTPAVRDALKANASDPSVVKLGGAAADQLRQAGDYQGADAITKLDPKFQAASAQTKGEAQARQAVDVTTVGEERAALEKGGKDAYQHNQQVADQVFAQAGKDKKDLPPNVESVPTNDPNRATLVARNKNGDIVSQTTAIRDGDKTTIEKTTWDKGRANFSSTAAGANGDFTATQASWKAAPSATPGSPDINALKNSRDPNVQVQQQSVHRDGDKLVDTEYGQGKTGVTQTTKTYEQQSKDDASHSGGGIKDDFQDKFSDKQPVDVLNTHTVSIPAGGQKGADGKPAAPQISDSATFSQGQMRLERDAGTQQFKTDGDGPAKDFHPAANDVAALDKLPGWTKDTKSPVQWKLEESKGNTYDAQTFVEGHTDLSTVTHREAHGSTVTESVSGKVPTGHDDDTADISSKTTQTYAADGSLSHLHKDAHDADGTHTVTNFDRTTKPTSDGLDINEHLNVQRTGKDGQQFQVDRKTDSLLNNKGVQLVSSDETVTGPDGSTGRTLVDKNGTQSFIDGAEVKGKADVAAYSKDAQHLVAQSGADTFNEVQSYINNGGVNAVKLLGIGKEIPPLEEGGNTPLADANNALHQKLVDKFGEDNVETAFRVQSGAVGAVGALGGLAGAVSNTQQVVDGIRNGDIGKIATGVAGDIQSGLAVKNGGKAFLDAVKGLSPETLTSDEKYVNTALKTAGWLDKVPGLSEELATKGGIAAADASEFLGKLGGPASVAGVAISGYQLYNAIDSGNGYKIAEAGVGLAGAVATGAVLGSVEPGLGTVIGAGIGLATFGVQQLIGLFDHSDTDIADVKI